MEHLSRQKESEKSFTCPSHAIRRFLIKRPGFMHGRMDEVQLANYVAGIDPGPVVAGQVDREMAKHLAVRAGALILLSDFTLTKTKYRHPEIDFRDYKMLSTILSNGFVTPGNKARSVEVCYLDTTPPAFRLWRVSLKATRLYEVYVTMFHRLNKKEARRLYRRARRRRTLLRDHKGQLAQRELRYASGA